MNAYTMEKSDQDDKDKSYILEILFHLLLMLTLPFKGKSYSCFHPLHCGRLAMSIF